MSYFLSPQISQPHSTRTGARQTPNTAAEPRAPGLPGAPTPSCPSSSILLGSWLRSSSLPGNRLFTPTRVILFLSALVQPKGSPVALWAGRPEGYIPVSTHPQNSVSPPSIPLVSLAHLPLWIGPRKTSRKGPSAWQLKDALEPVSVIPSSLDSEGSLSVWGGSGGRKKCKSLRNLPCILLQNFSFNGTASPWLPSCKPIASCWVGLFHPRGSANPSSLRGH